MGWVKKGLIFSSIKMIDWAISHAQVPIPDIISKDTLRIYFASRDNLGRSLPTYIDVNSNNLQEIKAINKKPLLELGSKGTFDDCGIIPSWVITKENGDKWMYYIGWNVRSTIPYHNSEPLMDFYQYEKDNVL